MYVPPFNAIDDDGEIRAMVAEIATGWLISIDDGGNPMATLLPIMWRDDTVIAHMAKANRQWRLMEDGSRALVIVAGPNAYISPSWYAAKREHGRVVPTWNYTEVHLSGELRLHHDSEWLRTAVTDLTETHESHRADPWQVSDAPDAFVDAQLRGIVGIEVTVDTVEAKAKLSQNRSVEDRLGVIAGLGEEQRPQSAAVATAMRSLDN
jgi:transcriptional regulator